MTDEGLGKKCEKQHLRSEGRQGKNFNGEAAKAEAKEMIIFDRSGKLFESLR